MTSSRVKITAYGVSSVYAIALAISGLQLPGIITKLLSFLPLAIVMVFAVFDQWVWCLRRISVATRRPNLIGTWRGQLVSLRQNDEGLEVEHDPVPVAVVVRESFTTITITLMTPESKSRSVAEVLQRNSNGDYTIYYQYNNIPKLGVRDRSPIHAGSASIEFAGETPKVLMGEYWTARRTRGTFTVKLVARTISGSYEDASLLQPSGER
jgi:hypothetical protein